MDVLAFCIVLLVLAAFVAAPLYRPRPAPSAPDTRAVASAREEAVSRALDDLDVDRASGLVDEPTYALERHELESDAASRLGTRRPPSD